MYKSDYYKLNIIKTNNLNNLEVTKVVYKFDTNDQQTVFSYFRGIDADFSQHIRSREIKSFFSRVFIVTHSTTY